MSPNRRRLLFASLVAMLSLILIEAISHATLALLGDSLARLNARRDALAGFERGRDLVVSGLRGWNRDVVLHPYLGFVYEQHLAPDRHGLLGDDILAAAEGERNVVIAGGSVAGNLFSELGDELRLRLEALPAFEGQRVRLYSFSVGGWHQPQQAMAVAYFLALGARIPELEAAGVPVLDATGLFRDVGETIYVDPCCHMNPAGRRRLMEALLGFVQERGILQ